jgi:hypothetical protein
MTGAVPVAVGEKCPRGHNLQAGGVIDSSVQCSCRGARHSGGHHVRACRACLLDGWDTARYFPPHHPRPDPGLGVTVSGSWRSTPWAPMARRVRGLILN